MSRSWPQDRRVTNLQGEGGFVYKSGAGALAIPEGRFVKALEAHSDTVVSSAVSPKAYGDALANVNRPKGSVWFGEFTSITLSSGEVTGYLD